MVSFIFILCNMVIFIQLFIHGSLNEFINRAQDEDRMEEKEGQYV
ncbi:hypothetical protein XNC1_3972 [Xenorhabdus nematophila ATCC 19061]|uniref:Uncharacterized protein n=1 Tax=Xenorhabdus nematophila (strain ATCC 19061 / DSM 3370 / CCUG 14189 / LMG 1036 / NCIMB 9965 / AN6) TaxID=406817 RepID=D3VCG5_XENNA|nr:hypothetical protein XNC1_3972 [Xenorhabdus nematophila ATCC 19061]